MAYETLDFFIAPTDGWVLVATNPSFLRIRPSVVRNYKVAITAAGAPASQQVAATGTLTLTGNALNGETVKVGGITYTFLTVFVDAPNNILIGLTASDSLDNLIAAINNGAGEGTLYGTGTVKNPDANAAAGAGDTMDLTAQVPGTKGNSVATTETLSLGSFGAATLTGGVDELQGLSFGQNTYQGRDEFILPAFAAQTLEAYIKVLDPAAPGSIEKMHFGVIRDQ